MGVAATIIASFTLFGGIVRITGLPDSPPSRTGTAIADVLAGLDAGIGILAGLVALRTAVRTRRSISP